MANELQVFAYDDKVVRTVDKGGEPWWVLKDVCAVLELDNHRNVTARLDEDEKGVHTVDTLGGRQEMTIISESGLYSVIMQSRKPEAKAFRRWVTHEVLPSIRKTGAYAVSGAESDRIAQLEARLDCMIGLLATCVRAVNSVANANARITKAASMPVERRENVYRINDRLRKMDELAGKLPTGAKRA